MLTLWMNTNYSNSSNRRYPGARGHYVYFCPGWLVNTHALIFTLALPHANSTHPHLHPRSMLQKTLASVA